MTVENLRLPITTTNTLTSESVTFTSTGVETGITGVYITSDGTLTTTPAMTSGYAYTYPTTTTYPSIYTTTGTTSITFPPSTSIQVGDYTIETDDKKTLHFKDGKGDICFSVRDGALMLGDKTIYEVVYEMVQMMVGGENTMHWLTDEDRHKRSIAKVIHKNKNKKTRKRTRT